MDDQLKYGLAILAIVLLFALPFFVNPSAKFGGADDAGSRAIQTQQPGYVRWILPLWTPPPETESMLFALQAALGALVIGYFIGYEKARSDISKIKEGPHDKVNNGPEGKDKRKD